MHESLFSLFYMCAANKTLLSVRLSTMLRCPAVLYTCTVANRYTLSPGHFCRQILH